jgi:hypothetical protein
MSNPLLDVWHYEPGATPRAFGEPTSYHKAYEYLADCPMVEDWGCALAYGRTIRPPGSYRGIDGAPTAAEYADEIADLTGYTSDVDGIVIRHVLEHNPQWEKILANAVESFRRKLVLVTFTPFSAGDTYVMATTHPGIPDISFRKTDLERYFDPFIVGEETLTTDTQFQTEHLFYVEKRPAP